MSINKRTKKAHGVDMEVEQWRDVVGYEGFYQVSNWGRVRSVDRTFIRSNGLPQSFKGRLMIPRKGKHGHRFVSLQKVGKISQLYVHRLVLTMFVGPCPKNMEGCHYDGNPANNRLDNLRWDTHKNNHLDQLRHGTSPLGKPSPCRTLTVPQVKAARWMYKSGHFVLREITKLLQCSNLEVVRCAIKRRSYKDID